MGKAKMEQPSLEAMKACYKDAKNNGDKEEEAKWANQIGHMYNRKGEYMKALDWFKRDYQISTRNGGLDSTKLMPTCQSLGEAYLRLSYYDDALTYQLKHYHLAVEANDLVEQQRASTQLGRTYVDLYENKDNPSGLKGAKMYFEISLQLVRKLRASPPSKDSSPSAFVKELVDAYNNVGLLKLLIEDHEQARSFFTKGLNICDEEELDEIDDARSRLHHNLGRLHSELREWDKAKQHLEMDISICQRIPHAQGEAKGLVNLAGFYFKIQEFEQAARCFKRALAIAQTLEDEEALCTSIKRNIETVDEAKVRLKKIEVQMQQQKKLRREVEAARGTVSERTTMKRECKLLHDLIGDAHDIQAWDMHLGLAKRLKALATWLGDSEKLGDALEVIGSSYYNLRNFQKAKKWHLQSWELCKRIGHKEGQVVAKINLGNILDSTGDWTEGLKAYQEAYEGAKAVNNLRMLTQQILAMENIHYCYIVRLDLPEEARRVECELQHLKARRDMLESSVDREDERCSESDGEGPSKDCDLEDKSDDENTHKSSQRHGRVSRMHSQRSRIIVDDSEDPEEENNDDDDDDAPLSILLSSKRKGCPLQEISSNKSPRVDKRLHKQNLLGKSRPDVKLPFRSKSNNSGGSPLSGAQRRHQSRTLKYSQVVLSDDEESNITIQTTIKPSLPIQSISDSVGFVEDSESDDGMMDVLITGRKRNLSSVRHYAANCRDVPSKEGRSSIPKKRNMRSKSPVLDSSLQPVHDVIGVVDHLSNGAQVELQTDGSVKLSTNKIAGPAPTIPSTPVQVSSPYTLNTTDAHQSRSFSTTESGVAKFLITVQVPPSGAPLTPCDVNCSELPMLVQSDMEKHKSSNTQPCTSEALQTANAYHNIRASNNDNISEPKHSLDDPGGNLYADTLNKELHIVEGADIPLWMRYVRNCLNAGLSQNLLLVNRLQSPKISEDEVVVAKCNLQDQCAKPLLAALRESETFSVLDMSHNQLGNSTVHGIQELIKLTNQKDLGLTLDLHCNKLGAGALTQICQCPVTLSRLEVLNLSGNRLTDAAARHLSAMVEHSKALATLSLESCGLTTRSVLKLASALHSESSLAKLCIGNNKPIDGYALQTLLEKLSQLTSFAELDLKGLELDESAVTDVCNLVKKSKSITSLNMEGTDLRNDGARVISDGLETSWRLSKLNLSRCGFSLEPAVKLCSRLLSIHSLTNLSLSSNDLDYKAAQVIAQALAQTSSRLKTLVLSNCQIGRSGILIIMHSLRENSTLGDLNLAGNIVDDTRPADLPSRVPCRSFEQSEGHSSAHASNLRIGLDDYLEENCCSSRGPHETSASLAHDGAQSRCLQDDRVLAQDDAESKRVDRETVDELGIPICSSRVEVCCATVTSPAGFSLPRSNEERSAVLEAGYIELRDGQTNTNPMASLERDKNTVVDDPEEIQLAVFLNSDLAYPNVQQKLKQQLCKEGGVGWGPHVKPCQLHVPVHEQAEVGITNCPTSSTLLYPVQLPVDVLEVEGKNFPAQSSPGVQTNVIDPSPRRERPVATSTFVEGPSAFCEDLAAAVSMARGLGQLDLSGNQLTGGDVELLFTAWSASTRGKLIHQKHVEEDIVHFFAHVGSCQCANAPCCISH